MLQQLQPWQDWTEDVSLAYQSFTGSTEYLVQPVLDYVLDNFPHITQWNTCNLRKLSKLMRWCKRPDKAWDNTNTDKDNTKYKPNFMIQWESCGILLAGAQRTLSWCQLKLIRSHSKAPPEYPLPSQPCCIIISFGHGKTNNCSA